MLSSCSLADQDVLFITPAMGIWSSFVHLCLNITTLITNELFVTFTISLTLLLTVCWRRANIMHCMQYLPLHILNAWGNFLHFYFFLGESWRWWRGGGGLPSESLNTRKPPPPQEAKPERLIKCPIWQDVSDGWGGGGEAGRDRG
jgi:hypothetical protein